MAGSSGGGINLTGGTLNITGGSLTGNTATVYNGGGIATYNSVRNQNNTVTYYDSVVSITNSSITNNRSVPDSSNFNANASQGNGGGMYMEGAVFTMTNSTVSGNYGLVSGGGISIRNGGSYNITGTTLSGNSTGDGVTTHYCDGGGGGLFSRAANGTISNSTISGNLSRGYNTSGIDQNGNGVYSGASGGGGIGTNAGLNLRNVTIAYNRAPNGPGGGINTTAIYLSPATVTMSNTIIANNSNVRDDGFTNPGAYNPGRKRCVYFAGL